MVTGAIDTARRDRNFPSISWFSITAPAKLPSARGIKAIVARPEPLHRPGARPRKLRRDDNGITGAGNDA